MTVYCAKCRTSRTGDKLGEPCRTKGCDGTIERQPEFRELVEDLPERMTCGRRAESGMDQLSPLSGSGPNLDHWQRFKSNGDRVCSYCGSLHFEDMVRLVKASAEAPLDADYGSVVEIQPSSKNYKVYVNQPGVKNAMDGGIKFYMQHVPRDADGNNTVTKDQNAEFSTAVKNSQARFNRMILSIRKV